MKRLRWSEPHAYLYVLVIVIAAGIALTALADTPRKLPSVAFGSTALFHVERVVALLIASLVVLVVLSRAWAGQLPSAISGQGMTYPTEAKQAMEEVEGAVEFLLPSERDPTVEKPEGPASKDLLTLRLKLEAKMAYIAKWLLRDRERVSYVTIGSLNYDGYLTDQEARAATHVLTLREEELDRLSRQERQEFLRNSDKLVRNLRASVFFGLVRETLKLNQWDVEEVEADGVPRPDLLAANGEQRFRITPRFATTPRSRILERAKDHLAAASEDAPVDERRIVVLPDNSRVNSDAASDPAILKFRELVEMLDLDRDPRSLG